MNKLKRFFWHCSGSNLELLEEAPTESAKYVGIGATIFFTGIFAGIAAGYAIFTFSGNFWLTIPFALIWGGMIFNLDRYIVASMRKSNSWKKEWAMALPRIILAIIISLVIARPLEIKIFDKEINTELTAINEEIAKSRRDSVNMYYLKLKNIEEQNIKLLQAAIMQSKTKRDKLRALAAAEADGTGGSLKRNPGPIYQIKKANADQAEKELEEISRINQALIVNKRSRIHELDLENQQKLKLLKEPDFNGFAGRLEALARLTNKHYSIWLANLFILLLFIAIETAPVVVKLISSKGPYDYLLATEEYKHELAWLNSKAKQHTKTRKSAKNLNPAEQEYVDEYLLSNLH